MEDDLRMDDDLRMEDDLRMDDNLMMEDMEDDLVMEVVAPAAYSFGILLLTMVPTCIFLFDEDSFDGDSIFHNLLVLGLHVSLVCVALRNPEQQPAGFEFLDRVLERLYWGLPKFFDRALKGFPIVKVL